jgi:hypothetical protein
MPSDKVRCQKSSFTRLALQPCSADASHCAAAAAAAAAKSQTDKNDYVPAIVTGSCNRETRTRGFGVNLFIVVAHFNMAKHNSAVTGD